MFNNSAEIKNDKKKKKIILNRTKVISLVGSSLDVLRIITICMFINIVDYGTTLVIASISIVKSTILN